MAIDLKVLVLVTPTIESSAVLNGLQAAGVKAITVADNLVNAVSGDVDVLVVPAREVMLQRELLPADVALLGIACNDAAVDAKAQEQTHGWLPLDASRPLMEQEISATSKRYRSQRKAALMQAVDALGQFAGGTAHDFNNILTVVLGNLEILQMSSLPDAGRRLVNDALAAAERGVSFTRRLGHLSNRSGDTQLLDLNAFARNACELIRQDMSEQFDVSINLSTQNIPVVASTLRLEKVMLNLADNARDAMPEGGRIVIETRRAPVNVDSLHGGRRGAALRGDYALITMIDEGDGMPADVVRRAPELYFSTRCRGRASGIGLSVADAFLQADGGALGIDSTPAVGTRVHCYLPLVDSEDIVMNGPA